METYKKNSQYKRNKRLCGKMTLSSKSKPRKECLCDCKDCNEEGFWNHCQGEMCYSIEDEN